MWVYFLFSYFVPKRGSKFLNFAEKRIIIEGELFFERINIGIFLDQKRLLKLKVCSLTCYMCFFRIGFPSANASYGRQCGGHTRMEVSKIIF